MTDDRSLNAMNLTPPNLRIPLQPRSHLFAYLGVGVLLATVAAYLWNPSLGAAFAATVAVVLPAMLIARLVPLRRSRDLGSGSLGSLMLLALLVIHLLAATRWLLPWLLSRFG